MKTYTTFTTKETSQQERMPGRNDQVQNSAGGFVFEVNKWTRLRRFLIMGSEGGTFYIKEQNLTKDNAKNVISCIQEDGLRTVKEILEVSHLGLAPKNDPALFCLALATDPKIANLETRQAAFAALPKVARIGTHLFHFIAYMKQFRGWSNATKKAISDWYLNMPVEKLAFQLTKYQQRDGWSHRDILRLCHANPKNSSDPESYDKLFKYVTQEKFNLFDDENRSFALKVPYLIGVERAKQVNNEDEILSLIRDYNLPMEVIPTQLRTQKVYESMISNYGMTALIRNLANLTRTGVLSEKKNIDSVVEKLANRDVIRKSRVHPMQILVALKTYASGGGYKSKNTWSPIRAINDALDQAFYMSFDNVESTNKRFLLAFDVSGSMGSGVNGLSNISCREASAAMGMTTFMTEDNVIPMAFTGGSIYNRNQNLNNIKPFSMSRSENLSSLTERMSRMDFGGTDCALPMLWATHNQAEVDCFVIYTDSETWAGSIHPTQALKQYREKSGIPAKLVVLGMASNGFSIADQTDPGQLDVVGLSADVPILINRFAKGEI